ncbi:MAG: YceD family protein [Chloroflexota bacterium]
MTLSFDVKTLLKAPLGQSLTLDIDTGHEVLDDLEVDYLRGSVRAIRVEKGVFVEGVVESQLRLECVRCLEPFAFPATLELAELFRMPGTDIRPDAIYAVSEDGELDLAPLIREHAWLSIPMKHLCDPQCKGLCPHCGVNLNTESCECEETHVDPRLAPLKELL